MSTNSTNTPTDKLHQETQWLSSTLLLGILACLSGFILALPLVFSHWLQINLIGHTLIGSVSVIPVCFYCFIHFKRTLGMRNPTLLLSGLVACVLLLLLFGSGFWMALKGQVEHQLWLGVDLSFIHALLAYVVIVIIGLHLIAHILSKRSKKKTSNNALFISLSKRWRTQSLLTVIIYLFCITLFAILYGYFNTAEPDTPKADYTYDYGEHPFRPSQTETTSGSFVKVEQIAKSAQCGSCHTDIYQQWLSSTHRQAASDPAYVKNINLLEANRGIAATRYCEGCHAPVALLTGELSEGGKHGGIPDTPAHLEGVGCLGCHGIAEVVHTNGTASYRFDPKERYLFDSSQTLLPQIMRNFLIRLNPQPHQQAMGSALMEDPKLCASCHEQFMDKSMNDWGWVKMQSEYVNWLASPFSGQNAQSFQTDTQQTCQSCHFPLVAGNDPSADGNGFIHSHRSLGANTVLPMLNGDEAQLEATKQFLQSAKVLVDIEEPHRKDTLQNHQFINQGLRHRDEDNTPFFLYLGEKAQLRITVTNRLVGHSFPAGTTDINQAWLYFTVSDADQQIIYESGNLNEDLSLDENAHTYHSVPVDKSGQHIWKHDLFRMTGNAYKNVIQSGKSDIKEYTFEVPSWAQEPLTATVILKYRKFNQRYAKWALDHPRPVLPIVEMARDSLTIPLKIKPIIDSANAASNL
ncbi:MAG: hypothetical protein ACI9NY_000894 [Kiritimatiellia bacterium]|jgi:hypothetical protein